MTVLSNGQLRDWIHEVMDRVETSCPATVFNTLSITFFTGLRLEEANNPNRWSILGDGNLLVELSKRSPPRVITDEQVKGIVIPQLEGLAITFGQYSNDSIRRMVQENSPYFIWRGKDQLITHAWRYNYIRQLGEQGYTVTQIKAITLISSSQIVEGYLNLPIIQY